MSQVTPISSQNTAIPTNGQTPTEASPLGTTSSNPNTDLQNKALDLPSWLYWMLLTAGVLAGVLLSSWVRGQAALPSE